MMSLHCYFCGGRLSPDNAWLEIYDQQLPPFRSPKVRFNRHGGKKERGMLTYPGGGCQIEKWSGGYERVALFTHTGCGPDVGYSISLEDVAKRLEFWRKHLSEGKVWWCSAIADALKVGREAMLRAGANE